MTTQHYTTVIIWVYKTVLSSLIALLTGVTHACRYNPTCSEFWHEAVVRHGWVAGSILAGKRLMRCRPGAASGYDPVPTRRVV